MRLEEIDNLQLEAIDIANSLESIVACDQVEIRNAIEQARTEAMANRKYVRGETYYQGVLVEQDYEQAKAWFETGAKLGSSDCKYYLGVMYEKGQGVEQNEVQAKWWYAQAAQQGNFSGNMTDFKKAKERLEQIAEQLHCVFKA